MTELLAGWVVGPGSTRVLVGAVVLALGAALAASTLRVDSSFRRQFSASARVRLDDQALNSAFGGTSTLVLLIDGGREGSIDDPQVLGAIDRVQKWLAAEPGVGKTLSVVDFVRRMHTVMATDGAAALPTERDLVAQYWLLYSMSGSADDFDSIVDPSHRISALRVYLKDDRTELASDLIARLETRLAEEMPPGTHVEITGSLASSHAMNEVMVDGKVRNIAQIAALVFLVASLILRSFVGGLLVVLPLAFAVATNFAAMALLDIPLDIGTSAISAMAVGIGADYAIYFLYRLREELSSGGSLDDALRRSLLTSGKAILFVSSAIAAGYLTLCLSGFGYHVRLGSLVAFAMMVSSMASLTVLPAAVWRFRPRFLVGGAVDPGVPREAVRS